MARKKGTQLTAPQRARCAPGTFTRERRQKFLDKFRSGTSVAVAARHAGVSDVTVFVTKRRDPEFAKQYAEAFELNLDCLEDTLRKFALAGNVTALFGCLRAFRPAVWRESQTVKVEDGGFTAAFAQAMTQAQGVTPVGVTTEASRLGPAVH